MYDDKPQREILDEQRLIVKDDEFSCGCGEEIAQNIDRFSVTANPQGFRVF